VAEKHALASFASTEIAVRKHTVVAVPLGSCEQHGAHLPLGTDSIIAEYLCRQLSSSDSSIVVAPTIAITASGEHAGFAGTLSIGTEALSTVLVELVRSADWANAVVFVNGHGGNAEAVARALRLVHAEGRNAFAWWPSLPQGDAHAGHTETSMMLAIAPHLVDMSLAQKGNTAALLELEPMLRAEGVLGVSTNGVLGDPRQANAQEGFDYLDQLQRSLTEFVMQHCTSSVSS
jgi:creatinine amidohydrolase